MKIYNYGEKFYIVFNNVPSSSTTGTTGTTSAARYGRPQLRWSHRKASLAYLVTH